MDQYLSTVIIALITGIFSIITLIIQKKQDKVINKIDEQTKFIEKEKNVKKKLNQKEKERDVLIHQMMILILDTNLYILKNTDAGGTSIPDDHVFKLSDDLKEEFDRLTKEIHELTKEYELILDITSEFQRDDDNNK